METITLREICSELNIDTRKARRILRSIFGVSRARWTFDEVEATEVMFALIA